MNLISSAFALAGLAFVLGSSVQTARADFAPEPTTKAERDLAAPLVINCAARWSGDFASAVSECRYMKSLFVRSYFKAMHGDPFQQELMWSYLHVGVSDGVRYDPVLGCAFGIEAYSDPSMTLPNFLRSHYIKCAQMPDVLAVQAGLDAEIRNLTATSNRKSEFSPVSASH